MKRDKCNTRGKRENKIDMAIELLGGPSNNSINKLKKNRKKKDIQVLLMINQMVKMV